MGIYIVVLLQCLIILLIFEQKKPKSENNNSFENEKNIQIFRNGIQQTLNLIDVSLYKMYNDCEIVDFDTLQERLKLTFNTFLQDPKLMEEWSQKYLQYISKGTNNEKF